MPAQDNYVFGVAKTTGITNIEQWMAVKTPLKLGAIAPSDGTYDIPKVMEAALGLPVQVVTGSKVRRRFGLRLTAARWPV